MPSSQSSNLWLTRFIPGDMPREGLPAGLARTARRVFVCHFLRFDEPSALVREIASGFETLLAGEAFIRDNIDCLNYPVKEACFEHFSIFIPAGEPTKV